MVEDERIAQLHSVLQLAVERIEQQLLEVVLAGDREPLARTYGIGSQAETGVPPEQWAIFGGGDERFSGVVEGGVPRHPLSNR